MNLKQLEAFVHVAEGESFSKAAKELFLTQPTVSAHIAGLEKELNARLFVRNTKEVKLSEEGKLLYDSAKQIVALQKKIEKTFLENEKKEEHCITIAASTIPAQYLLPEILVKFNEKYPNEQFKVIETDSAKVVEEVLNHTVDIGFTGTVIDKKHCKYVPFYQDELIIIAPNNEKFRKLQETSSDTRWILQEPLIMREEGSGTRKEAEKQLKKSGVEIGRLNIVASMENQEAIKKSVSNGMGVSIISRLAAEEVFAESGGMRMIYMDNAATTMRKPKEVAEAVMHAMNSMGNAGRGANEASLSAARVIYDTRELLADFFDAENPKQIVFTSNSTESLNIAIKGILNPKDHAITTMLEHNSVLRPLYEMEERGVELSIVKSDRKGNISYEEIEHEIRQNTKAIICTHGSNLTGNMIDIKRVGEIAKKHGLLFVVDASQTAGVYPIDVQEMHIDILCFTGHKSLLGPQGTGGMYVREGVKVRPLKTGGSGVQTYNKKHPAEMPTALEAGTLNGHGIAGLHASLSYLKTEGIEKIRKRELEHMWKFYRGVKNIPGVKVYGDFDTENRCPIVTLNIGEYDSSEVSDELLVTYGISTRPGAHCAPLMHEALGTVEQGAVRFSFSHYNTEEEVETAIRAIEELAEEE